MDAEKFNVDYFNNFGKGTLPDHLGIVITSVKENEIVAEFTVTKNHLAPNGFLHAGSVVTLADTACGYACFSHLPDGAQNFTTIELKSNHLGTAREGTVVATATAVHLGRTTQVWDATVINKDTGKTIALFRCTQMVLYPKNN
ncbi:hotdog fold thioesterase [Duganella sp. FT135W]|uniref:Hotdog fold thioesterase n=1 Tax=Duganella flavida TaxID=2692175 RepID=A0A6L8K8E4_9BURK|nr:PaaI family thioesterase [Duganella flavida]MYM22837.1 hotdog fold thioesterase [Duganella flavida]